MRITTGRARVLNSARPAWVMVGLEWDGPGVLLMASDRLSRAQLDFEARRYDFRDIADMLANFTPSLALTAIIDTRPAAGRKDGYVLIAAPDWVQAMQELFGEWTPEPEQHALPAAPDGGEQHASGDGQAHTTVAPGAVAIANSAAVTRSDHGRQ
jgi:hypothetical protein